MITSIRYGMALLLCWCMAHTLGAQQETNCDPFANQPITQGEVIFNYGSITNAFSFRNRTSFTISQPAVGVSVSQTYSSQFGFWTRFLLPPQAPQVMVSQGDFPDRVLIQWELDPLSATAEGGYIVLRDGAFLGQTDAGITQLIDFNVQAGEFYEYSVLGRNQFGRGMPGKAIGFVNPNGVVTGKVETFSGNPVAGAIVTLTPTIGTSLQFDGVNDYLCVTHLPVVPTDMFTASAWVKIGATYDSDGILDLGSDFNKNFWLHTTPAGAGKGIVAGVGDGTASQSLTAMFAEDPDGWHQVTAVYGGGSLILYVDGLFAGSMKAPIANEAALITIGSRRDQTGFFDGMIDDVRLFNRPLTGTEVFLTKDITVSSNMDGLVAYWKMDEGIGAKAFDLTANDMHAFINGATFNSSTPAITNAAMTDEGGAYAIEGVNYSTVQSFTATPSKIFYQQYALEFNSAYEACATLTDFDLPDTATVEIVIHPFDLTSRQSLLNKGTGDFELFIENNLYKLTINGQTQDLGPASTAYQHISLTLNGATGQVQYFRNGTLSQTLSYTDLTGDWTGSAWQLAANTPGAPANFYTGLIDEVAFYDTTLTVANIQLNASQFGTGGTDTGNPYLLSYFPLDEGDGTVIDDYGPALSGAGAVKDAPFSIITYRQKESPHVFRPSTRAVIVNASTTAASGIDFVDESTVTISGVVRFENTFCYQDSVEILVNGQPAFPRIFTDENGRFVGDFEPGVTVTLSPRFDEHVFFPGFFQARRLNRPIAGVLYQNQTKREVSGQITGGTCRLSIIPEGARVKVKIQALNDCYSRELLLENADGNYRFTGLPPIPMAVTITEHSNNVIYNYFQVQGGTEIDLRLIEKDTVDFVYIAPPNVYIQPFPETGCAGSGVKTIDQSSPQNGYRAYTSNIRVFERYDGGDCYLDSFTLIINNDIADEPQYEIQVDTTIFPLTYYAGLPNLGGDHTKFLQVTAQVNGALATNDEEVVVLGERSRESTFTTASPAMPLIILRDPPGDASSSTLATGSTHCQTWSQASMLETTQSRELNLDLGAKVITYAGSPVGGVITETETIANLDFSASATIGVGEESTAEVCLTNDIEYSTTSGDAVFFGDADLYVGAAVNFEFSSTDILSYDPDACDFTLSQSVRMWPGGFGTKYVYSEWQIETDVIPSLLLIGDTTSADNWKRIIQYNQNLKDAARFRENITFDGLVSITETQTTSSTSSYTFNTDINWTLAMNETLGFEAFGNGQKVQLGVSISGGETITQGNASSESRAVSYTLADDDPNDNFTVDIFDDPVFGTPVFKLRSGESMCPWEPGTLNREEVGFAIDRLTAVNISENDAAIFRLSLTNQGQTGNDPLIYTLGVVEGGNPDGALVKVDGEGLTVSPISFQILPFETLEVLLTVEKGPATYSYDDIGIYMASECQLAHSRGLGYDLAGNYAENPSEFQGQYRTEDLDKFYKEFRLDVEFLEPCSPIDIGFPMQGWVQRPQDGNIVFITLNEYLYNDPDLELVRVQYRRTGGDGAWINIIELPKAEFANSPVFKIVQWDMAELVDGAYEIRAITQCFDVSLPAGISKIVQGRKETRPPALLGTPQPADGVLSPGDEISVTFTKRIRCDRIFQADGIGTNINVNNLALIDLTEGGILVDATISCSGDKILIVPNVPNQFIENHTLKVVVTDIEDLYGNMADQIEWEFFVNRSNLFWAGGSIDEVVFEGNSLTVTREIRNQSGQITSYSLDNIPDWMQVFPTAGAIEPGASRIITFTFPADLVTDAYATVLEMSTIDGIEPLNIDLRVACEGPDWSFDPTLYTFSMNLTVQLDIEGDLSEDKLDRVAAFIGGELRGLAYVQYNRALDRHLAFMTVYSDMAVGETVTFQIWDASECLLYGSTVETFPYTADGFVGTPLEPQVIHTNNQLLRKIYIHPGWNWISYNIDLIDPSTNAALSSLTNPDGATIKGQTMFSSYAVLPNLPGAWYGSLNQLSHLTMYQYRSMSHDSLLLIGAPVDPSTPMPIQAGWNWIGYLPQQGMPVTDALSSLTPLNGDLVKGQFQFAQYVAGVGWIGNLNFMSSPNGYLLRISNPGTLVYPDMDNVQPDDEAQALVAAATPRNSPHQTYEQALRKVMLLNHWTVNPGDFEFSMNLIGIVDAGEAANALSEGDEIAAFVNGEVRGTSQVVYVESLDSYLVFLTVYANREGETLQFKWYDQSAQSEVPLVENFSFLINALMGNVAEPFAFHTTTTSVAQAVDANAALSVFPNPAKDHVYFRFDANVNESIAIRVTDALGREVGRLTTEALGVRHTLEWNTRHLAAGLYVVTLHRADGSQVRQMFQVSK